MHNWQALQISQENPSVSQSAVLDALRQVMDPDLRKDIVALDFVKDLRICGGAVAFTIELTTPACPVKDLLRQQALEVVKAVPGVERVEVQMTARVRRATSTSVGEGLQAVKNLVAVASGKGGVGKSTVAVNLAVALASSGARIGLMDADVYGPSTPKLMGNVGERPLPIPNSTMLQPLQRFGIRYMSMGLLTGPDTPVIWRGPMATKLVQQFLSQVAWGELDYLILDLPPGTGDVQLTITQAAPLTGAILVTTPQELAVGVTLRGLRMFEQVRVPILGIVENMSGFVCPHCQQTTPIFQQGGGQRAALELGVPFLGSIPLDPAITKASDQGAPISAGDPADGLSQSAAAFAKLATLVAQQVSIVVQRTRETQFQPKEVSARQGMVRIVWQDEHESLYPARELRLACPCALCVDEWSGAKRLDPDSVAKDVELLECHYVGRYALNLVWSDRHRSGIYPLDRLRELDRSATRT